MIQAMATKIDLSEARSMGASLLSEMARVLVGRESLAESLVAGLIAGGHVLIEGVPGIAKTLAARALASASGLSCSRIQFTADLLPADLTGALTYDQRSGSFSARKGPVFANIVIADEINRAPAKVQGALLEAMEERKVTIGEQSIALPEPFMVAATQNPLEHEGTYPLPEAELDRFMAKVLADYPTAEEEAAIVSTADSRSLGAAVRPSLPPGGVEALRGAARDIRVDPAIVSYIVSLVRATRPGEGSVDPSGRPREYARFLDFGASPRASIAIFSLARARALMDGRGAVLPDDVKAVAPDALRHRLCLSYDAQAEGVDAEEVLAMALAAVPAP
jgi:MoxR-like ATPase